jgi:hypothetical protein
MGNQRKPVMIIGEDISGFDKMHCPLDSSIFVLNINERAALLAILKIWKDDSGRRWLMSREEYDSLIEKLKKTIVYETI